MTTSSSPLRVLAVTNMYPTIERPSFGAFVQSQLESVARAGATVQVELIDGRRSAWNYARAIPRVRRLTRSGSFDLVHAHYGLAGFSSSFHHLPLVVSFCGDDLLGTPTRGGGLTAKSRLARRMSFWAARRADAIICKSEEMRDRLPRLEDRARAHVIANGVEIERFSPGERQGARVRLGLSPRTWLVLFPNAPSERRKRVELAEAAVEVLRTEGVPVDLLIVQGVAPAAMPDYYRAADCLLLTSDWEGSPNVVKEALCCDLPVVSVDAGDVRRWLTLTPGCQLVDQSPQAIAAGLRLVLAGPRRVDGSRVRAEIALPAVAERVMSVYADALDRAEITPGADDTAPHSRV